jgi:hypothetical protein
MGVSSEIECVNEGQTDGEDQDGNDKLPIFFICAPGNDSTHGIAGDLACLILLSLGLLFARARKRTA